jgi:hypothetical protein
VRQDKSRQARERVEKARVEKVEVERTRKQRSVRAGSEKGESPGKTDKPADRLDRIIAVAERRWGSLLPPWVFTKMMLAIAAGALVLTVILPGLVSSFLLVSGLLLVLFGAIAYTDQILAAKWLPGRMTPMHALLFGVAVLMLGVVVGVIA